MGHNMVLSHSTYIWMPFSDEDFLIISHAVSSSDFVRLRASLPFFLRTMHQQFAVVYFETTVTPQEGVQEFIYTFGIGSARCCTHCNCWKFKLFTSYCLPRRSNGGEKVCALDT